MALDDTDPVGVSEIAAAAGVKPDTVKKWIDRHATFPTPRGTVGGDRAWLWGDVRSWLVSTGRPAGTTFVVYTDSAGAAQIEECDKAGWAAIAADAAKSVVCVTDIWDVARRAKGVEPRDLGNGVTLTGRIRPDTPAGPEHDQFEHLVVHRAPGADPVTLHVWAQGAADLPRAIRLAVAALRSDNES